MNHYELVNYPGGQGINFLDDAGNKQSADHQYLRYHIDMTFGRDQDLDKLAALSYGYSVSSHLFFPTIKVHASDAAQSVGNSMSEFGWLNGAEIPMTLHHAVAKPSHHRKADRGSIWITVDTKTTEGKVFENPRVKRLDVTHLLEHKNEAACRFLDLLDVGETQTTLIGMQAAARFGDYLKLSSRMQRFQPWLLLTPLKQSSNPGEAVFSFMHVKEIVSEQTLKGDLILLRSRPPAYFHSEYLSRVSQTGEGNDCTAVAGPSSSARQSETEQTSLPPESAVASGSGSNSNSFRRLFRSKPKAKGD